MPAPLLQISYMQKLHSSIFFSSTSFHLHNIFNICKNFSYLVGQQDHTLQSNSASIPVLNETAAGPRSDIIYGIVTVIQKKWHGISIPAILQKAIYIRKRGLTPVSRDEEGTWNGDLKPYNFNTAAQASN